MTPIKVIIKARDALSYAYDSLWAFFYKKAMGHCGKNVLIKPSTSIFKGVENFYISDDVRIARYAMIYSTNAKVIIGSKVGIAPYLKIVTGNHRMNDIGNFMFDGNIPKEKNDDKDVIIEGDNWFGANVTILSSVTIGRGSIVASGAVVNKSFPPYSIIGGLPAKILKFRFTIDEVIEHERILYPENQRLTRKELENMRAPYLA